MDIKPLISEVLEIDPRELHRIELEDISLSSEAENNLNIIISNMIDSAQPVTATAGELLAKIDELIDCRGFWMESTRELLLYLQVLNQIKTIVVPAHQWRIQHIATIH